MAGFDDFLKLLLYGANMWKKFGEPTYTVVKESRNTKEKIKLMEKDLQNLGIDISLLQDDKYIESMSQEQKNAIYRYNSFKSNLYENLNDAQSKAQNHIYQQENMNSVKSKLIKMGIDLEQIKDRNYVLSLEPTQQRAINLYHRLQLHYLDMDRQEEFNKVFEQLEKL